MNTAKLLKRAPTLIMIVCLAYACYKIHATLPDSGSGPQMSWRKAWMSW